MIKDRIISKRKELGVNQTALAKKVGVTRSSISNWELGDAVPSGENLYNLCSVLDCTPEWLLYGKSGKVKGFSCPIIDFSQIELYLSSKDKPKTKDVFFCPIECSKNSFSFFYSGISMNPSIVRGDIVFVDPEIRPVDNSCALVKLKNNSLSLKLISIEDGIKFISSTNQSLPQLIQEIESDSILGTVVFSGKLYSGK